MDSIIPEDSIKSQPKNQSSEQKKVAAKKVTKPVKPLVEGINSPRSTQDIILVKNNLSQKEKELITKQPNSNEPLSKPEPRLMPESVAYSINKKNHHIGRWLLIFVVLLILIAGGYELYVWQLQRGQEPIVGHYHPPAFDATQPFPLAGESLPTSSSPTIISATASSTVATTTPTSTPAAILQVKINSTPTGFLNVRNAPSSSGKVITQVHPGEVYTYTNVQNNWYEITYSGFNQGWVSGQYVTKQ